MDVNIFLDCEIGCFRDLVETGICPSGEETVQLMQRQQVI